MACDLRPYSRTSRSPYPECRTVKRWWSEVGSRNDPFHPNPLIRPVGSDGTDHFDNRLLTTNASLFYIQGKESGRSGSRAEGHKPCTRRPHSERTFSPGQAIAHRPP